MPKSPFFLSSNMITLKLYGIKHFIRAQEMKKASHPIAIINSPINPAISHLFYVLFAGVLHFSAAVHFFFWGGYLSSNGQQGLKKAKSVWPFGRQQQQHLLYMHGYFFRGDEGKI
jgi:hypothetical protein